MTSSLIGVQATTWLHNRGWADNGPADLRLFADEVSSFNLRLARVWSSSTFCARLPESTDRRTFILLCCVEGEFDVVDPASRRSRVRAGGFLMVDPRQPMSIVAERPFVRFEIEIPIHLLTPLAQRLISHAERVTPAPALSRMVVSLANHLFKLPTEVEPAVFIAIRRAMEALVEAVICSAVPQSFLDPSLTRAELLLLKRTYTVVMNRSEAGLTVAGLAAELGVSRVYLHRVLRRVGMTASALIGSAAHLHGDAVA